VPITEAIFRNASIEDAEFKVDLERYLAKQPTALVHSLSEILDLGLYHVDPGSMLRWRNQTGTRQPLQISSPQYRAALARRTSIASEVVAAMDARGVLALAFPTVRRKPARIGEPQNGGNCELAANSGLPALTVPAGFTSDGLPLGLELVGRPFAELDLLRLGSALESEGLLRRAPASTPPLHPEVPRDAAPSETTPDAPSDKTVPSLEATFRWNASTSTLVYDVLVNDIAPRDVLLVALRRGGPAESGPVLARLARSGQTESQGQVLLATTDRAAVSTGRLYVQVFTRAEPLGAVRKQVVLK